MSTSRTESGNATGFGKRTAWLLLVLNAFVCSIFDTVGERLGHVNEIHCVLRRAFKSFLLHPFFTDDADSRCNPRKVNRLPLTPRISDSSTSNASANAGSLSIMYLRRLCTESRMLNWTSRRHRTLSGGANAIATRYLAIVWDLAQARPPWRTVCRDSLRIGRMALSGTSNVKH